MINRCYHSKDRFSAYYGTCTVCEEWLNFQVFADWYETHEYPVNERLHLDKDILFAGNKEYAPKKCMLVPQRLNMMFMNKPNKRGLPNGIIEHPKGALGQQDYYKTQGLAFLMLVESLIHHEFEEASRAVQGFSVQDCLLHPE